MTERTIEQRLSTIEAVLGIEASKQPTEQQPPTIEDAAALLGKFAICKLVNGNEIQGVVTGITHADFDGHERIEIAGVMFELFEISSLAHVPIEPKPAHFGIRAQNVGSHYGYETKERGGAVASIEDAARVAVNGGYVNIERINGKTASYSVRGVFIDNEGICSIETNGGHSVPNDSTVAAMEFVER